MGNDLIKVVSLPVIKDRLRTLEPEIKKIVEDSLSLVCTEETIQTVKSKRAELNKLSAEMEEQRKDVKKSIMDPYNAFEAVYKECVTDALKAADIALKGKIDAVESEQKRRCEEGLRDYFEELVSVHHVEWLTYDRAGIKVDMASAKAKTPKRLREQLTAFVVRVSDDVNRIASLDDSAEIMVEYQRSLDAADAICMVQDRHKRIEEQKSVQESVREAKEREEEAIKRVDALTAPVVSKENELTYQCTFTVHATKAQLKFIKEFLNMEGIKYE